MIDFLKNQQTLINNPPIFNRLKLLKSALCFIVNRLSGVWWVNPDNTFIEALAICRKSGRVIFTIKNY